METVAEQSLVLQRFGAADYAVFSLMLLVCVAIGVYFGFFAGARSADEYLMGGRQMGTLPVTMSLIASYISGVTLLGLPTEIYLNGTQYINVIWGAFVMAIALAFGYLPVFHDLQVTTTYQYLQMRFGNEGRLIGSIFFALGIMAWLPIVVYVPAIAFNQVTGVNVHIVSTTVCLICIFYTSLGGLKAVVWTDVVQMTAMFGSMVLVAAKATADVGGFPVVWWRNWESGRIEAPNWSLDPTVRLTMVEMTFGSGALWLQSGAITQFQMQRFLALPSLRAARRAVWLFLAGCVFIVLVTGYCGMVIYATYYDCDPLTTKLATAKDQLLPLLVMRTLGDLPGLPGCFIAGIFSAALSSLSTSMNSMAAVVLEDFYKLFFKKRPLSPRQTDWLMKSVVVVVGVLCVALVFVVERLGAVLELNISLAGITEGPMLGIFTMGLFFPWVNRTGMLVGSCSGLAFMGWLVLGGRAARASGAIGVSPKPLTTAGCDYNFTAPLSTVLHNLTLTATEPTPTEESVMPLYRLSFLWYTLTGCVVSTAVALLASFATGANKASDVDERLLSPLIRPFISRSKKRRLEQSRRPEPANDTAYFKEYQLMEMKTITPLSGAEEKEVMLKE